MILQFIKWNPDPIIFSIGPVSVRWYGLLFATAFLSGYLIIQKIFKKEGSPPAILDGLTTYMIVATVVGARLGHCLFYEPGYYLHNPLEILKIWKGGLASHGAAVGIIFALYLFSRKTKIPVLWYLDRIVIVVALAGFFIRLGNLMNSEIIGSITTLPWGFYFLRHYEQGIAQQVRHPAQLYESLLYLLIFIVLYKQYFRFKGKFRHGFLFALFLILVFGVRFMVEFVKKEQVDFEQNMFLNMGQVLSIPFILLGIFILLYPRLRKIQP